MSRRFATTFRLPEPERPAPTYPEYAQLLADAQAAHAKDGQFVDPRKVHQVERLPRDWDWMLRVLGHEYTRRSMLEVHLLLLAHERDLDPPLPQWVVDARAAAAAAQAEKQAAAQRLEDAARAVWDAARKDCPVELRVLLNANAHVGRNLGHAVPDVECVSGRQRRHLAGRALCETATRAKPLNLEGGKGTAVTCVSCLKYTPLIRPA